MSRPKTDPIVRFWAKVAKGDGCWNWTGAISRAGYGCLKVEGKYVPAHRYSLQMAGTTIANGLVVDHLCHNRKCVRPEHLRVVTQKQNLEHRTGPNSTSTTGVRGVSWNKARGHYIVQVYHNGKRYIGGRFADLEEAAEAARQLRLSLYTCNEHDRRAPNANNAA